MVSRCETHEIAGMWEVFMHLPILLAAVAGTLAAQNPWVYNEYIDTRDNRRLAQSLFRFLLQPALPALAPFDASGVRPGPVAVDSSAGNVVVTWHDESSRTWRAEFSLRRDQRNQPLITSISVDGKRIVERATPIYRVTTGKRRGGWDEFFDHPPTHPDGTRSFRADFGLRSARAR